MSEIPQTLGEQLVSLDFNHAEGETHDKVHELKKHYAAIIDILCPGGDLPTGTDVKSRILGRAVNDALGGQMWAVKGVTYSK